MILWLMRGVWRWQRRSTSCSLHPVDGTPRMVPRGPDITWYHVNGTYTDEPDIHCYQHVAKQ